jgi:hypothetical protein
LRVTVIPAALLIGLWFVTQLVNVGAVADVQTVELSIWPMLAALFFGCVTARLFEREEMTVAKYSEHEE